MHSKIVMFLAAVLCSAAILITPSLSSAWWGKKTDDTDKQETIDQTSPAQEASEPAPETNIAGPESALPAPAEPVAQQEGMFEGSIEPASDEPVAAEIGSGVEEPSPVEPVVPAAHQEGISEENIEPATVEPAISESNENQTESAPKESVIDEVGIYYTVKKGDTLWDISQKFFDSSWVWPDLWSQNKQIPNPHIIYPGDRIHIYKHEGSYVIEKVPSDENAIEQSEQGVTEEAAEAGAIQITEEPEPVEKAEPEKVKKPLGQYQFSKIDRVGFIREDAVIAHGAIINMEGDKKLISKGDIVYIKQNEAAPPIIAGGLYTVYRTQKEPIRDKKAKITYGIQHNLRGVVEITEIQPDYAVARVVKNFEDINIKDMIMPYKRLAPEIPITEGVEGLDGKIIISEEHEPIFGELAIVFIDKGEKDGVLSGQSYSIYYKEQIGAVTRDIDFGSLLVLRTEYSTSTAIILQSQNSVKAGAKTHTRPK